MTTENRAPDMVQVQCTRVREYLFQGGVAYQNVQCPTFYIAKKGNGIGGLLAEVSQIIPTAVYDSVSLLDMSTGEILK